MPREALKQGWQEGLSSAQAVELAVAALTAAADEDRATGGVDLERRIFPVVKICSESGVEDSPENEIEQAYRGIISRRASNAGAASR